MTDGAGRVIRVLSLYDDVMNVYADRGNTLAVQRGAAALGLEADVLRVSLGEALPEAVNLVLIGGGQDREQRRIADELAAHGPRLREWAAEGVAMLAVCGGFQLFGRWYRDTAGRTLPGAGVFDVTSVAGGAGQPRCIGDVLVDSTLEGVGEVVGFENHGGRTYLGPAAQPFARVLYGSGNNGADGTEGAVHREAIGTYLHGSVLPKNPRLLRHLLAAAARHAGIEALPSVEGADGLMARAAERAHRAAVLVARRRGRPVAR
ncbi:MAG: glutamine amidotransferase [Dehalococcoidia bacterium]|nr:glutamine amidotransferase [Dehalococcoidia bacterium]